MKRTQTLIHLEFSSKSAAELRGHQSVRTTFKLTEESINALAMLAGQLGIKQKSLFDHLIEDSRALEIIAGEYDSVANDSPRVAKTYVISRRTLDALEYVSTKFNTPRDVLVEYSIKRIMPLLDQEKKKHQRRKEYLGVLQKILTDGIELVEKVEQELGQEDPVFMELYQMVRSVDKCCENVELIIEKGSRLDYI